MTRGRNDPAGQDAGAALMQALGGNADGTSVIGKLLGNANLAPGQAELVQMFLSMQGGGEADDGLDMASTANNWEDDVPQSPEPATTATRAQELEALHEVNDTVAAALGACRYCWGGDELCEECQGAGAPGSRMPDKALFQELVLPALKRVQAAKMIRKTGSTRGEGR